MSFFDSIAGWFGYSRRDAPTGLVRTKGADPPKRGEKAFLEAHERSIELRRITGKVWDGVSAVPFELMRNGKPVEKHALLTLFNRPNPEMSASQMRALQTLYLDLDGEAPVLLIPNERGEIEHCPVPKSWCTPRYENGRHLLRVEMANSIHEFEVGVDAYVLKKIDPKNPYGRGQGLGHALIDEAQTAEYAAEHAKSFFHNSAKPELLIHMEGAGKAKIDEAKASWDERYRGARNAYQVAFIGGPKSVVIQELTERFKDLGLVEFRKFLGDHMRQLFGVPPEIIGQLDSSNKATIMAAIEIFAMFCLEPRCNLLKSEYEAKVLPMFPGTEGMTVEYVSPVPTDKDFKLKVMEKRPEAYTINEWRALSGDPPRADGDVYLRRRDMWEMVDAADIIDITPIKSATPPPIPDNTVVLHIMPEPSVLQIIDEAV